MIAGIVAEYNPFHNGHLYHINEVKKSGADYIVCVMSGNFVQRGECACLSKWKRAEIAVKNGADVVIDLPTPFSSASAETFARGAVGLLLDFGVDFISFGSETDSKEKLLVCLKALQNERIIELTKVKMSEGLTYPKALSLAVEALYGKATAEILLSPNSTLGIEYLKALKSYGRENDFLPVLRKGASHDSSEAMGNIASASLIREAELSENVKGFLPGISYEILEAEKEKGLAPCSLKNNERGILSSLREIPKEDYSLYISDETGLSDRIYTSLKTATTLSQLYDSVKVKNYTHSRIRREILMLYLRCPKSLSEGRVPYMKILAASERGLALLKNAKENSTVPVITRHAEKDSLTEKGKALYDFECTATDKFAFMSKIIRESGEEQKQSFFKCKIQSAVPSVTRGVTPSPKGVAKQQNVK